MDKALAPVPGLRDAQNRARMQLAGLPPENKMLIEAKPYPVRYSDKLEKSRLALIEKMKSRNFSCLTDRKDDKRLNHENRNQAGRYHRSGRH